MPARIHVASDNAKRSCAHARRPQSIDDIATPASRRQYEIDFCLWHASGFPLLQCSTCRSFRHAPRINTQPGTKSQQTTSLIAEVRGAQSVAAAHRSPPVTTFPDTKATAGGSRQRPEVRWQHPAPLLDVARQRLTLRSLASCALDIDQHTRIFPPGLVRHPSPV